MSRTKSKSTINLTAIREETEDKEGEVLFYFSFITIKRKLINLLQVLRKTKK
jgi:hypothetical protein